MQIEELKKIEEFKEKEENLKEIHLIEDNKKEDKL